MKLCRFGAVGEERPGLVNSQGVILDLSGVVSDITPDMLSTSGLEYLARIEGAQLPQVAPGVRFGVPVSGVSKYIGIGLNYADHAEEAGLPIPKEPIIFSKAINCLSGPNDSVIVPKGSTQLDYEVELAVVIGARTSNVTANEAMACIAGYCLANDVSERAFQFQSGQWDKGKGCDSFGPLGPWLVTKDEIPDPQNLALWLKVNGQARQAGHTSTMIFGISEIVSAVSQYMTLLPGDVICTGTPPGVAMGIKPEPIWLKPGDIIELGADCLGVQTQRVVEFGSPG